jgi:DNA invertase Pin-like site-specific DNA recombinase
VKAVAYLRTSSAANVGDDKDSASRQTAAIERYAASAGFEIVDSYYDAAVSGGDPIDERPGFTAMLDRLLSNGVRTIIVEDAGRFARDLIVQETGFQMLRKLGIDLIAADHPNAFLDDTPTAVMVRQILGAVRQFQRAEVRAKLRSGRAKKIALEGRSGGRKGHAELNPKAVREAKRLHRKNPVSGRRLSLREIGAELEKLGHLNQRGQRYGAQSVQALLNAKVLKSKEESV